MSERYLEEVVGLGDDASQMLFEGCKATWSIREGQYGEVIADLDNFRGERHWSDRPLQEIPRPEGIVRTQEADGIGTKVRVSQMTSSYEGAPSDLMAMANDDPASKGYEPVIVTTSLAVNRITDRNGQYMEQLARGAVRSARISRTALYGGETAILGNLIGGYGSPEINLHFIWDATVHALGHEERIVDGTSVKPGMAIVGLREPGLRSNGITMVRDTLKEAHGPYWHKKPFESQQDGLTTLGQAVLRGSTIYTPVLVDAIGGFDLRREGKANVAGAAHITGGGVKKLLEMLAVSGYGTDIEDPYEAPEIMKYVLWAAGVPDRDAYGMLHMGSGMIVATDEPEKFVGVAAENDVEAKIIGMVRREPGVTIRSAGVTQSGRKLKFAA